MINYQNSVVDNYPLYQAFIDLYYKFINQKEGAAGEIIYHAESLDIDRVLDEEITNFYDLYAKELPLSIAYNKRNLIKILNQIYEAKGTENSLKLLFRLIYDEDINISYPIENVLKTSDGKWSKEQYFTVYKHSGVFPPENSRIVFSNENGDFSVITTGLEIIDDDVCRLRFSSLNKVYLPMEQMVTHTDGENTYFVGKVIPSPQKLRILKPGKYWKKGKAIVIPGSVRDTVAVISSVSTGGVITGMEILEYGIGHQQNQVSIISPFPRKPTGSMQDLSFEITSVNPAAVGVGFTDHPGVTYHHTINIEDYVDGLADEVTGIAAGYTHNSYFLSYYMLEDYLGTIEIHTATNSVANRDQGRDTDIRTWQDSLALLMYEHDSLVDMKGKYLGDEGQLSNQLIKIQDSYFYQAFSYLLESIQDPKAYKKMADLFHPAGTKRFSGYIKQIDESLQYTFRRAFLVDTIVLREHMSFADSRPPLLIGKNIQESLAPTPDAIRYKIDVKTLLDPVNPSYIKFWHDIKILKDTVTYLDINPKTVFKSFVLDSVSETDTRTKTAVKYFTLDAVTPSHINPKTVIKPRADTVTYTDNQVPKWDWKILNDSQIQSDTRPRLTDVKPLSDTQSTLETLLKVMFKTGSSFSDVSTAVHTLDKIDFTKSHVTDSSTPTHTRPALTDSKVLNDSQIQTDTRPILTDTKALASSETPTDSARRSLNKTGGNLVDTATATHIDFVTAGKALASSESPTDSAPIFIKGKGFIDTETPTDSRPRLTPLRALQDSQAAADQYAKALGKASLSDSVSIVSIDGNAALVDGRWDSTYAGEDYSEAFKYIAFSN